MTLASLWQGSRRGHQVVKLDSARHAATAGEALWHSGPERSCCLTKGVRSVEPSQESARDPPECCLSVAGAAGEQATTTTKSLTLLGGRRVEAVGKAL